MPFVRVIAMPLQCCVTKGRELQKAKELIVGYERLVEEYREDLDVLRKKVHERDRVIAELRRGGGRDDQRGDEPVWQHEQQQGQRWQQQQPELQNQQLEHQEQQQQQQERQGVYQQQQQQLSLQQQQQNQYRYQQQQQRQPYSQPSGGSPPSGAPLSDWDQQQEHEQAQAMVLGMAVRPSHGGPLAPRPPSARSSGWRAGGRWASPPPRRTRTGWR